MFQKGMNKIVSTTLAPAAIGPYSQAVIANGFVFTSGSICIVPSTGELSGGDITVQSKQAIDNLVEVLKAAGSDIKKVVKTTVFLKDMNDFGAMNKIYGEYFAHKPARSTVEVARLPKDVLFEIECVATL